MANVNAPFGLQLIRASGAYSFNGQGNLYVVTAGNTDAFYLNDAVTVAAGGDAAGIPAIAKSAGTGLIRGSIQAIYPVNPNPPVSLVGTALSLENTNIPATKAAAYYVLISDDYTGVYMIQDDGITTANLVAASCNLNSSLTVAAGATPYSASATVLLSSSFATTLGLPIKLTGLVQQAGNVYGAYAKWQCRINQSDVTPSGATGA